MRIDLEFMTYAKVARRDYDRLTLWRRSEVQFRARWQGHPDEEWMLSSEHLARIDRKIDEMSATVVIFAALALEAFLFDYAATNLGDAFVDAHIDKLDLPSKWVLIPRLVCDCEIPRDGTTYQLVRSLQRRRHALVHRKSKGLQPWSAGEFHAAVRKMLDRRDEMVTEWPDEAIAALDHVACDLDGYDANARAAFWLARPQASEPAT